MTLEDDSFEEELLNSEKEILKEIEKTLSESKSYEEAYEKLTFNYRNLEFKKLDELLFKAIASSDLRGVVND